MIPARLLPNSWEVFDLLAEIFSFDFILFFDKSSYDKTADDVAIIIAIEYYGEHLDGFYRKNWQQISMLLFYLVINRYLIREWSRSSYGDFYSGNDTKIFQTFV